MAPLPFSLHFYIWPNRFAIASSEIAIRGGFGKINEAIYGDTEIARLTTMALAEDAVYEDIHKRLMLVATVMLTIAAAARMSFIPSSYPIFVSIWLSPIYPAMIYDYSRTRKVHLAYVIGLITLAIVPLRDTVAITEEWQSFAAWFITLIT